MICCYSSFQKIIVWSMISPFFSLQPRETQPIPASWWRISAKLTVFEKKGFNCTASSRTQDMRSADSHSFSFHILHKSMPRSVELLCSVTSVYRIYFTTDSCCNFANKRFQHMPDLSGRGSGCSCLATFTSKTQSQAKVNTFHLQWLLPASEKTHLQPLNACSRANSGCSCFCFHMGVFSKIFLIYIFVLPSPNPETVQSSLIWIQSCKSWIEVIPA